jgi:hypothetical protein
MSNNTASSAAFHDANEFAVYELSCEICPVLSCLSLVLAEHRRQGTCKPELNGLAHLPPYQLSTTA